MELRCPADPTHVLEKYAVSPERKWCELCVRSYLITELVKYDSEDIDRQDAPGSWPVSFNGVRDLNKHEPPPVSSNEIQPAVWDLVQMDMDQRDKTGAKRYGTRLRPHNGRDALIDAYQEALDLVVYLRQAIYERDGM